MCGVHQSSESKNNPLTKMLNAMLQIKGFRCRLSGPIFNSNEQQDFLQGKDDVR